MSSIFAHTPIPERIRIIEEALERVLDRGPEMSVEPGNEPGTMFVWVIEKLYSDTRTGFSLHEIAKDLEVLLP